MLSFHGSSHLDDPSLIEAYIRPPIITLEHNLKLSHFDSSTFFFIVLLVRECSVLVDSSIPIVDSRVEEVSSVDLESNYS